MPSITHFKHRITSVAALCVVTSCVSQDARTEVSCGASVKAASECP